MYGIADAEPYKITGNNLTDTWGTAIKTIWSCGDTVVDQRGNTIKEILNLSLHIRGSKNDYPDKCPCNLRYAEDFADGLVKDEIALQKAESFDYSYGERIRRDNALNNVIELLKTAPTTRNAVLPVFQNSDTYRSLNRARGLTKDNEVPCVTHAMMIIRRGKLHFDLFMRSNDYVGAMPSDVYGYRTLQRYIAEEVGVEVGTYTHTVMSAHIITENDTDFMNKFMESK